jgi:hypothetical protein
MLSNPQRLTKAIVVTYSLVTVLATSVGTVARAEAPTIKEFTVELPAKTVNYLFATDKPTVAEFRNAKEQLTDTELVDLLHSVGFQGKSLKTAWAVVKRESNGRPLAHNDNINTGDNSYGIFQINMIGTLGEDRRAKFGLDSNKQLFDPVTNAEIVFHMTNGGSDWSSWDIGSEAYNGGVNEPAFYKWLKKYPSDYKVDN